MNNCVIYYLRIGNVADDILRAMLIILEQLTREPLFDKFRIKEQLGFDVKSGAHYSGPTMGYSILIQSDRAAWYLESRIDLFLTSFARRLKDVPNEEFNTQKHSAINRLNAKFEDLYDETTSFWKHIESEDFHFLQDETDVTLIRNLSKADLLDFYQCCARQAEALNVAVRKKLNYSMNNFNRQTSKTERERHYQLYCHRLQVLPAWRG